MSGSESAKNTFKFDPIKHNKRKLPKYFIIGVMKGGTTILYDYICTHPQVVGGKHKEVHYFSLYPDRGLDWYADQFADVPEDRNTIDASPTYFDTAHNRAIPAHIKAVVPDARLILVVRDPVARAVSHFTHLKTIVKIKLLEDLSAEQFFSRDYAQAITQRDAIDSLLYQTLSFSSYYRRFTYYQSQFPPEQVLVLTNDQLSSEPIATMKRVFDHIELPWQENKLFGTFRYSSGSSVNELSEKTYNRLANLLYPDYERFRTIAKLPLSGQKLSTGIEPAIPGDSTETVHKGHDGWLFLIGGSNRVLDYYLKPNAFSQSDKDKWWRLLNKRRAELRKKGIKYVHLMAPEKLSVYPDRYIGRLPHFHGHPARALFVHKSGREGLDFVVNPTDFFSKIKNDVVLYWKTDTHWTFHGCFAAYQLICSKLGYSANNDLLNRSFHEGPVGFDLGSKLDPPIKEIGRFYQVIQNSQRVYANCLVEHQEKEKIFGDISLHVGTNVVFRNEHEEAHDAVVILFGDSFAEYRPHLLTGLLAETFREVHYIWSSALDYSYIERVRPNIVITEIAERFMGRVPVDKLDITTFAKDRLDVFKQKRNRTEVNG